jgi:hypothetical protein
VSFKVSVGSLLLHQTVLVTHACIAQAAVDTSESQTLPPHPQNESNAAKLIELEQNYAA